MLVLLVSLELMYLTVGQYLKFLFLFRFGLVFVFCFCFSPQCLLSQQIYICAVQFSQQNLSMCAVWRKSRSFTQGEFSHFPSSHFVQFICAQCGGSGEVGAPGWLSNDCQATQTTGFPGPFRIPSNFLPFFSSP